MENFIVSARKYRPRRFDEVVGQSAVSNTLKNAIKNNHLAHSFLFCGPRGVGKTTCARILAKTINCLNVTADFEPCGECESCKSFAKNSSLNIFEMDAASNSHVEDIRNLIEQVRYAPQAGKYKVYIIDEVHMLSASAFNAFLKTLEEPPSYAIFILATTEKHKIIPTILSRCQIFDFSRIQVEDIVEYLQMICKKEGIEADPNGLRIIAQKADGALRDALSMFDRLISFSGQKLTFEDVLENLNILDYDYYFKVTDAIMAGDVSTALVILDDILRKGFDGDIFINGLGEHFRNLLVCKSPETLELLEVTGDLKARYEQQAKLAPKSMLLNGLNLANQCDIGYKMAKNKRLHVELSLIKMCHMQAAVKVLKNEKVEASEVSAPSTPNGSTAKSGSSLFTPPAKKKEPLAKEENIPADTVSTKEEKADDLVSNTSEPGVSEKESEPLPTPPPEIEEISSEAQASTVPPFEEPVVKKAEEPKEQYAEEQRKSEKIHQKAVGADAPKASGSLGAFLQEVDEELTRATVQKEEEEELDEDGKVDINIDLGKLKQSWNEYAQLLKEEKRMSLFDTMSQTEPLAEANVIKVEVQNKLQRELFQNETSELLEFIQQKLSVSNLELHLTVNKRKSTVNKVPYTSTEKLQKMAEKNPMLLKLKDKLNLELEF